MRKPINGILLLDKPLGLTSNSALQRMKHLFQAKKAGHTGSLDPLATGMLPICFGEATKFSQFLLDSDKTYLVSAQLGVTTNTGDREGEVTAQCEVPVFTNEQLNQMMQQFVGEIEQVPPMFSAIKVQGKPLYELARKGIEVERKARRINIFSMTFHEYSTETKQLSFTVHCSKGTYVRTLVEDMGRALGCGAHVAQLRRIHVTPYDGLPIYTEEQLRNIADNQGIAALTSTLLPLETSVQGFPGIKLSTSAAFYMRTGQAVRITVPINTSLVRLFSEDERFLGVGEVTSDGRVKPFRLLANADLPAAKVSNS